MPIFAAPEARAKLYKLINDAFSSHAPITITGKRSIAGALSKQDWISIRQTRCLCSMPGVSESLHGGIKMPLSICKADSNRLFDGRLSILNE